MIITHVFCLFLYPRKILQILQMFASMFLDCYVNVYTTFLLLILYSFIIYTIFIIIYTIFFYYLY